MICYGGSLLVNNGNGVSMESGNQKLMENVQNDIALIAFKGNSFLFDEQFLFFSVYAGIKEILMLLINAL